MAILMLRVAAVLSILAGSSAFAQAPAERFGGQALETEVKAVLLYNFAKYVD